MVNTANMTEKKMTARPIYVLGMPIMLSEKHRPESQLEVNLHDIYGQTNSVIVVPQSSNPTTAWDCCIRQYWRIAHLRKNELFSEDSDMVSALPRADPSRTPPTN